LSQKSALSNRTGRSLEGAVMRLNAPRMNGKVAATLMAKGGELPAKAPAIHKIEILADKLSR